MSGQQQEKCIVQMIARFRVEEQKWCFRIGRPDTSIHLLSFCELPVKSWFWCTSLQWHHLQSTVNSGSTCSDIGKQYHFHICCSCTCTVVYQPLRRPSPISLSAYKCDCHPMLSLSNQRIGYLETFESQRMLLATMFAMRWAGMANDGCTTLQRVVRHSVQSTSIVLTIAIIAVCMH